MQAAAEYTLMKWMFLIDPAVPFQFDRWVRLKPPSFRSARFPVIENVSLLRLLNVHVTSMRINAFVIALAGHVFLIQSRAFAHFVAPAFAL